MATLLQDTFTDTNGVALASHNADVPVSHIWTDGSSAYSIQGNRAQSITTAGAYIASADATVADYTIACDVIPDESSANAILGIVFRYLDANNYWQAVLYDDGGTQSFEIYERSGGTNTLRANIAFAFTVGNVYTISVTISGTSITAATVNGGNQPSQIPVTMGSGAGRTLCGIRSVENAGAGNRFDNFLVTGTAAAVTPSGWDAVSPREAINNRTVPVAY